MRGRVLLADRVRVLGVVGVAVPVQRNAGVVPAVRDGGDHWAAAGPAGAEAAEGGPGSQAPGGVRAGDRHRRARALGGPQLRRRPLQEAPLGRDLRGVVQKVCTFRASIVKFLFGLVWFGLVFVMLREGWSLRLIILCIGL